MRGFPTTSVVLVCTGTSVFSYTVVTTLCNALVGFVVGIGEREYDARLTTVVLSYKVAVLLLEGRGPVASTDVIAVGPGAV